MAKSIKDESYIGRRIRLRDLHVFFTVTQRGSMAKAAVDLGITQPAVSRVIADLEHALGVRLLDRSSQGVEATMYGNALLKRGGVAFDEIKQAIRDIEFLANPNVGEVRIGCPEFDHGCRSRTRYRTAFPPIPRDRPDCWRGRYPVLGFFGATDTKG